ncbi:ribonucleoside-diphosphate reductase, adenosylcobalamin-dependent, partial [bacterium]|nr:ribonucleoside-diphosphate reductase, adenosylcobalamin-dependent [bacterium]
FDYKKLGEVTKKAQRLMDDMIDLEVEQVNKILKKIKRDDEPDSVKKIENDLWKSVKQRAEQGRRTGLGITGLGDTLAMLGVKYGSEKSIAITEDIYKGLSVNSYESSIQLAKERGSFPIWSLKKEQTHAFISRILSEVSSESLEDYKKYGRRNIANTTTAPAGSVSVLTQTTSGIEPAYMLHYTRRKKITGQDSEANVDFVDDSGDKWQEYDVYHHGFKRWIDTIEGSDGETMSNEKLVDMSPYAGSTASEIDWVSKVKMQAAAQKWVCHAISNTTNLPSDVDVETVKKVYMAGWEQGCKGVTVYRDGSRDGVLVSEFKNRKMSVTEERNNEAISYHSAPRRKKSLECSINHATISGEKWTILVGLLDSRPYEIIGGLAKYVEIPKKYTEGTIIKHPRKTMNSKYDLVFGENGDEIVIKDIVALFDNPNHSAFTRTISLALRHGVPIQYVVEQLQKDRDADLFCFSKVTARVLKKYIEDGTKPGNGVMSCNCDTADECNIVYQEGCATCLTCGHAKCG